MDELAWAAIWIYKATNDNNYLNFAKQVYTSSGFASNKDELNWDSKVPGVKVLLAQVTGEANFINDVNNLCSHYINNVPRSPKGLAFFNEWGSLRRAAGAAWTCLAVKKPKPSLLFSIHSGCEMGF